MKPIIGLALGFLMEELEKGLNELRRLQDGLVGHQWEERPLGPMVFDAPV